MKKTILISVCVLVVIPGAVSIVKLTNPNFPDIFPDSTAYHIGIITGIIFKIILGSAGLIILLMNPYKKTQL